MAQVAVCSQTNTKHINTVWAERKIFECSTCWYITWPVGFKRFIHSFIHSLVFSLSGRASRNQSPVMRPVWLWHTAYEISGKICWSRTGHRWQYNMAHALCVLCKHGYRRALVVFNIYCSPWQLWLRERALVLRYTYIACLVAQNQLVFYWQECAKFSNDCLAFYVRAPHVH